MKYDVEPFPRDGANDLCFKMIAMEELDNRKKYKLLNEDKTGPGTNGGLFWNLVFTNDKDTCHQTASNYCAHFGDTVIVSSCQTLAQQEQVEDTIQLTTARETSTVQNTSQYSVVTQGISTTADTTTACLWANCAAKQEQQVQDATTAQQTQGKVIRELLL